MKGVSSKLIRVFSYFLFSFLVILIFSFCAEKKPTEPNELQTKTTLSKPGGVRPDLNLSTDSTKTKDKSKKKGGPGMESLETGWKYETEYVFDHYSAKAGIEFGILPMASQQYDAVVMEELHSYWGFNYVAIMIGNSTTVSNAQNYFGIDHTMAVTEANDAGRNVIQYNTNNGLPTTTFFWAYYTDEPATAQSLTSYALDSFENFVHSVRPNSLFGFGDVTRQEIGNYITNTITNSNGQTYPNLYPVNPDYVMCTKYDGDNIPRWDLIKNLTTKFTRTWINNEIDKGEFSNLLINLRDNGIKPWLFVETNNAQNRVQYISDYCYTAWQVGFLDRYFKQYLVLYHCILNHVHDPNSPGNCIWEEYDRTYQGIVIR